MLKSFARHGLFNLDVKVKGDIEVDCHHTIEDTGIVLGEAIKKHWEIKNPSEGTVLHCFLWMRPW